MFSPRPTQERPGGGGLPPSSRPGSLADLFLPAALLATLVAFFFSAPTSAESGDCRNLTSQKKKKSAIVFSYDRQAHPQIFTSHSKCLLLLLLFFNSRQFIQSGRSLHRRTLSCLSTMQQYFCVCVWGGGNPLTFYFGSTESVASAVTEGSSAIAQLPRLGQAEAATFQCRVHGSGAGFHP